MKSVATIVIFLILSISVWSNDVIYNGFFVKIEPSEQYQNHAIIEVVHLIGELSASDIEKKFEVELKSLPAFKISGEIEIKGKMFNFERTLFMVFGESFKQNFVVKGEKVSSSGNLVYKNKKLEISNFEFEATFTDERQNGTTRRISMTKIKENPQYIKLIQSMTIKKTKPPL